MASPPNRPLQAPRRSQATQRGYASPVPENGTNWILWTLLGILLVAGVSIVGWRLKYQANWQKNNDKIVALLESADQLILANRDDEAEAVAKQGLGLIPGDVRCQMVIERIDSKRKMILQRRSEISSATMSQAEELAKTDIGLATDALHKMTADETLTPEARAAAKSRIEALQGGVCTLRLPADWPKDAVLTLDGTAQRVVNGLVAGIVPGKRTVMITRYGFSDLPPLELDFRGLNELPLPAVGWKIRGAKVFVKSTPPGAAVWWQGKDTGKTTPFEMEDVDDGPVEFVLKHPNHVDTPLKGLVEDRQPLLLTATLKSSDESSP